jgi:hypothetical protein
MSLPPFASKKIGSKKLYKRVHGIKQNLQAGANTIEFTVPYDQAKIEGVEVINADALTVGDFEIYDTPDGTFSGTPNAKLNQFAFSTNIAKDYHSQRSRYDADLFLNMKLQIKLNSPSAKEVGVNFILNEVKP